MNAVSPNKCLNLRTNARGEAAITFPIHVARSREDTLDSLPIPERTSGLDTICPMTTCGLVRHPRSTCPVSQKECMHVQGNYQALMVSDTVYCLPSVSPAHTVGVLRRSGDGVAGFLLLPGSSPSHLTAVSLQLDWDSSTNAWVCSRFQKQGLSFRVPSVVKKHQNQLSIILSTCSLLCREIRAGT